jgi:hypothetical protein
MRVLFFSHISQFQVRKFRVLKLGFFSSLRFDLKLRWRIPRGTRLLDRRFRLLVKLMPGRILQLRMNVRANRGRHLFEPFMFRLAFLYRVQR